MHPEDHEGVSNPHDTFVTSMLHRIEGEMSQVRQSISKMADAIDRLSRLEEKHHVTSELAHDLKDRVEELEIDRVRKDTTIKIMGWGVKGIWAAIGSGVLVWVGNLAQSTGHTSVHP